MMERVEFGNHIKKTMNISYIIKIHSEKMPNLIIYVLLCFIHYKLFFPNFFL